MHFFTCFYINFKPNNSIIYIYFFTYTCMRDSLALEIKLIRIRMQAQQVQMVVWMLQHQLLVQLHTYVYRLPDRQTDISDDKSSSQFLAPDDLPGLRRQDTRVSDATSSGVWRHQSYWLGNI